MRGLLLLAIAAAGIATAPAAAQQRDFRKEYEAFKQRSLQQYDDFRKQANASYEKFMRDAWTKHNAQQAEPLPARPEPPKPVVKDPDAGPSNDAVPVDRVIEPVKPVEPPQPASPIPAPKPPKPDQPRFAFTFYGRSCSVPLEPKHNFTLRGTDENAVADGWARLSSDDYLPVISECLALRKQLRLCDWGYVRLLERMCAAFFGSSKPNEAQLMQMYILPQSGYKVRIARTDERIVLLLASTDNIYEYPYLTINNCRYYITDASLLSRSFAVFDREFPKERFFSLRITEEPLLAEEMTKPRTLVSTRYPEMKATVAVNRHLIDFYDDYPLNDMWNNYALASLSAKAKEQLYPALKPQLAGLSATDAANKLLNFVQTAFEYQTDDVQFGEERPLFADETLYYPYCDCEDRSILYAVLVRDLLGLDVVLLHYPEHLATAVRFEDSIIQGDYVKLNGVQYLVCDPTYIGASVGDAMPQFKRVAANIVRID